MNAESPERGFVTASVRMEALWSVSFLAPADDVDRIMARVIELDPLRMGQYDGCAFQTGPGLEHYRPLEGAAAGAEEAVRHRPGVVEVAFQLPRDRALLDGVVEAIFHAHSYQEPTIVVREILASRSLGRDGRSNPNRWWNRGGDWLKRTAADSAT